MRTQMVAATAAMAGLLLLSTLFLGGMQSDAFPIRDYSGADVGEAEAAFAASQSNEDLLQLLEILCWRFRAAGDTEAREPLLRYGQALLDRAKAETVDLERIGSPEATLAVLRIIRELGAR